MKEWHIVHGAHETFAAAVGDAAVEVIIAGAKAMEC